MLPLPPDISLTALAAILSAVALVVYDIRYAQLERITLPGERLHLIMRAALEGACVAALTFQSGWFVIGILFGLLNLLGTLMAEITLGQRQETEMQRAGTCPLPRERPPMMLWSV